MATHAIHKDTLRYDVPRQENQTVTDVVTFIRRYLDSTLAYRFACRAGMCGSCGMRVDVVAGNPEYLGPVA